MKEQIIAFFPEFNWIKDDDLREKSLAVWQEALTSGGWSVKDLDEIPFTLLIPKCPVSFRTHVQAVTQLAVETAKVLSQFYLKSYSLNMDYVVAGGLLHDIGKLLEYYRSGDGFVKSKSGKFLRHPFSGTGLAFKYGLPAEILHIIATHAKEGDLGYRSPEAIIVHHADFINFEPLHNLQAQ